MVNTRKGTIILLIVAFVVFAVLVSSYDKTELSEVAIKLVEENSYFSDFEINQESKKVIINCYLTFSNNTKEEECFEVTANFKSDEERGLLRQGKLEGVIRETGEGTFCLAAGETKGSYVQFVGEYGGRPKKANRNLPEEIIIRMGENEYRWKRQ